MNFGVNILMGWYNLVNMEMRSKQEIVLKLKELRKELDNLSGIPKNYEKINKLNNKITVLEWVLNNINNL